MHQSNDNQSFVSRLKERKTQRKVLWAIVLLITIIIISAQQDVNSFIGIVLLLNLSLIFTFFNKYANFSTFSFHTFISVFIAYFLSFSTIILLPLDCVISVQERANNDIKGNDESQSKLNIAWTFLYWSSIVILNLVFRLQFIYNNLGHLSIKKKIINTLKQFFKTLLIVLVIFGVLCILVAVKSNKDKKSAVETVKSSILVLSTIYGITVLVLLLGYGIVQFPLSLWQKTDREQLINVLLTKSENIFKNYRHAQIELKEAVEAYTKLITKIPRGHELYNYVEFMEKEIPQIEAISGTSSGMITQDYKKNQDKKVNLNQTKDIKEDDIAAARVILKEKMFNLEKFEKKWNNHYLEVEEISLLEQAQGQPQQEISQKKNSKELVQQLVNRQIKTKPMSLIEIIAWRIIALVLFSFSLLIIFSESTLVAGPNDSVLAFSQGAISAGQSNSKGSYAFLLIFVMIVLIYIVFCAYFTLFKVERLAMYELVEYETNDMTMMRNSSICLSLAQPLCYNVMMMFNQIDPIQAKQDPPVDLRSSFSKFYQPMKNVPFFGDHYNEIVPFFIFLLGFFTLFSPVLNIINKITKGKVNVELNKVDKEKIEKGEKVIINEYQRRQRERKQIETQNQRKQLDQKQQNQEQQKKGDKKVDSSKNSKGGKSDKSLEESISQSQQVIQGLQDQISSNSQNLNDIIIEGYLYKKGENTIINPWQKRYFKATQDGNSIAYYSDEKLKSKKGEIPVSLIQNLNTVETEKEVQLIVITNTRNYELKSMDKASGLKWKNYIKYLMDMNQINNL